MKWSRMRRHSEVRDKRETVHESAIRALQEALKAIGTLEKELQDMEADRDYWRKLAESRAADGGAKQ